MSAKVARGLDARLADVGRQVELDVVLAVVESDESERKELRQQEVGELRVDEDDCHLYTYIALVAIQQELANYIRKASTFID
ncbi:MAG TPA: hypothetical protein VF524_04515 [Polyangia bacterium]